MKTREVDEFGHIIDYDPYHPNFRKVKCPACNRICDADEIEDDGTCCNGVETNDP